MNTLVDRGSTQIKMTSNTIVSNDNETAVDLGDFNISFGVSV